MPFDRVTINSPGQPRYLSVDDFLGLPLNLRIALILRREVEFFQGVQPVDRRVALSSLRVQKVA